MKAEVRLRTGGRVVVEGSSEEVTAVLKSLEKEHPPASGRSTEDARTTDKRSFVVNQLTSLIDEGFLSQPRSTSEIHDKLEEGGHPFNPRVISTAALRLTRRKVLRRVKQDGQWKYIEVK